MRATTPPNVPSPGAPAPGPTENAGAPTGREPLTPRQRLVVGVLAFLQFTVLVDFILLAPLGAQLMEALDIDTAQFGLLVSVAAFSAGVAGFVTAGVVDRFDRKKLLLFVYAGFLAGTALCGVAPTFAFLLVARIVTGVFGGVIGSISMAIIADVFPLAVRGRVMGTVQTAFSAAQIAGLPAGLALASAWSWHAPFLLIAGVGAVAGVGIAVVLDPLNAHLQEPRRASVFAHMRHVASKPAHLHVFATTLVLASSFMVMPLFTPFFVNNLHVPLSQLPFLYMATGVCTLFLGPLTGKLADRFGKFLIFGAGSLLCSLVFVTWANLTGPAALWFVVVVNTLMFVANTARMIAVGTLVSAVPALPDRGAFLSMNTSLQQITGGVAAYVGGLVVTEGEGGRLTGFDTACFVVVAAIIAAVVPVWTIDRRVKAQQP